MHTRDDYMNDRCTHREYYAQFVTQLIRSFVMRNIGLDRILNSTCQHLNDIPIKEWDKLAETIRQNEGDFIRDVEGSVSLSTCVCIAKEAAKQLQPWHN